MELLGLGTPQVGPEHQYKFNDRELQEDFGLHWYSMDWRQLDPQLGRWTTIDPITHWAQSPFTGMDNNPVVFSDPMGLSTVDGDYDQLGLEAGFPNSYWAEQSGSGELETNSTEADDGSMSEEEMVQFWEEVVPALSLRENTTGRGGADIENRWANIPLLSNGSLEGSTIHNPQFINLPEGMAAFTDLQPHTQARYTLDGVQATPHGMNGVIERELAQNRNTVNFRFQPFFVVDNQPRLQEYITIVNPTARWDSNNGEARAAFVNWFSGNWSEIDFTKVYFRWPRLGHDRDGVVGGWNYGVIDVPRLVD